MAQREVSYENEVYKISYEIVNPTQEKAQVFLHGWGSNKETMKRSFSKEFSEYKQIFIDLPGFGNSSIATKVLETRDYANIIKKFLNSLGIKNCMMFGHSFGGKVATLLNPEILVLLSSAGILEKKSLSVLFKIKLFKTLKYILPQSFYKYFITSDAKGMDIIMYEILKRVINEDFSNLFSQRDGKTFIYWGKYDSATSLQSGEKIHQLIKGSSFCSYEGDHFFFLKFFHEIAKDLKMRLV